MYSLPERAAENIPYTWQHWLKIAHKPLIHHYRIFAQQAWDPQSPGSRFDVSSLLGYLIPTFFIVFLKAPLTISSRWPISLLLAALPFSASLFRFLQISRWWILSGSVSRKASRRENPFAKSESPQSQSSLCLLAQVLASSLICLDLHLRDGFTVGGLERDFKIGISFSIVLLSLSKHGQRCCFVNQPLLNQTVWLRWRHSIQERTVNCEELSTKQRQHHYSLWESNKELRKTGTRIIRRRSLKYQMGE